MQCGDCFVLVKSMERHSFDGVLTSPPYNMGSNPRHRKRSASDREFYDEHLDAMTEQEYIEKMCGLFTEFDRVVKPSGCVLWNMGVSTKNAVLPHLLIHAVHTRTEWTIADTVYWKKSGAMPFQTSSNKTSPFIEPVYVFARKHETRIFLSNKPLGKINERTGQQFYKPVPNVFEAPNGKSTVHNNATFSIEMAQTLLNRYFTAGTHVLDPFAGSGTTLKAAAHIGIKATGIEISKNKSTIFDTNNLKCLLYRMKKGVVTMTMIIVNE